MSKEYNRSQEEKALKKTKEIVKGWNLPNLDVEKLARKFKDHRKKCSCDMCRNPRTSKLTKGNGKLTIQERRIREDKS